MCKLVQLLEGVINCFNGSQALRGLLQLRPRTARMKVGRDHGQACVCVCVCVYVCVRVCVHVM